jgi:NSS family neurotransmitter:Na+ symporter
LVFAAWSSAISLIEPAVTWLVENWNMTRLSATLWSGSLIWALGLLTIFSFNIGTSWTLFNMTAFELLDYLTANIMLPLGGLFMAIFAGWLMKPSSTQDELKLNSVFGYKLWQILVRYITPAAIIIVFANLIGII